MSGPITPTLKVERLETYYYDGRQMLMDVDYGGGRHVELELPAPSFIHRDEWGAYISEMLSQYLPLDAAEFDELV